MKREFPTFRSESGMQKMSFDFSALLAPKKTKSAEPVAVGPMPEPPNEVIGRLMSESEIIELWQERACVIHEGNVELVQWCESQGFTIEKTWRYCELLAAGDLSMSYGTYVEAVINQRITKEVR
jgi:hypothetical protein